MALRSRRSVPGSGPAAFMCLAMCLAWTADVGAAEPDGVARGIERAQRQLDERVMAIGFMSHEWAVWDRIYAHLEAKSDALEKSDHVGRMLRDSRANLLAAVSNTGRVLLKAGFDTDKGTATPAPAEIDGHIEACPAWKRGDAKDSVKGVVLLPQSLMMVYSRPVLGLRGEGPVRGTIILGRYLDERELRLVNEGVGLPVGIRRIRDLQSPEDIRAAQCLIEGKARTTVEQVKEGVKAGYAIVNDIHGRPVALLRVDVDEKTQKEYRAGIMMLPFLLLAALRACVRFFIK